ncbi:unnamed protein product [Clonostachys solani]|uniref:Rhodopsin domain-containing protein n=1 Tax=Clonostachys solani TaxID=160281 RepID=A0A9N9YZK6_9HYPO|nr:unnamed protein product [Clonostachys solani]
MSGGDPDQLPAPVGFAAVILAVTCALAGLSIITVSLRTIVRISDKLFGLDDSLMLVGLPGTAICTSNQVIIYISYLVSVSSIVTDFACAILPIFILWSTQIRAWAKFSVAVVLGLGTLASVTTIARIPFLKAYREPEDNFLYQIGYVIILSLAECGIGLIAGSLPMARRLVRKWRGKDDETTETSRLTPLSFMTFGDSGRSRRNTIVSLGPRGRNGNPATGISQATVRAAQPSEAWEKLESGSARLPTPDKDKVESHSILERRSVIIEYEIGTLPGLSETRSLPRFSRSSWDNSLNRSRSSST